MAFDVMRPNIKQNALEMQEYFKQTAWRPVLCNLLSSGPMNTTKDFRRAHFQQIVAQHGRKHVQTMLDCSATYVGQLDGTGKQTRNIGDAKAREIEQLFGMAEGSMDLPLAHGRKASQPVSKIAPSQSLTNKVLQETLSRDTLQGSDISAADELQLIQWYRRLSPTNRRKLYMQAELYCLADDPDEADPFERAGIPNLLTKAKKKNVRKRDAA